MDKLTISIFGSKIFFEIISEIKLFAKFNIQYYEDLNLCVKNAENESHLVVFFTDLTNNIKINNFPFILANKSSKPKNILSNELKEHLKMPFTILDFKKKLLFFQPKMNLEKIP